MKPHNFHPTNWKHCGEFYVERVKRGQPGWKKDRRRYRCRICGEIVKDFPVNTVAEGDFNKMAAMVLKRMLKKGGQNV